MSRAPDPDTPPTPPAGSRSALDRFGRVTPEGALNDIGRCWDRFADATRLDDLTAPEDLPLVQAALARAVNLGQARVIARLAGNDMALSWHFQAVHTGDLELTLLPPAPSPAIARAVAERVGAGIALSDDEGRLRYVNRAYGRIYGRARASLIGHMFTDVLDPPDRGPALAHHRSVLDSGSGDGTTEYEVQDMDGRRRIVDVRETRLHLPDGRYRLATVVDATEHRQNARQLAEAEAQLRDLTDSIPGAVFRFRYTAAGEYRLDYISEGFRRMAGLPADEPLEEMSDWLNWIPDPHAQPFLDSVETSRRDGAPWSHEWPLDVPAGRIWLFGASRPNFHHDGDILWNGLLIDISARRAAEERLNETESSYRTIFENTSEGIFRTSREGRLLAANEPLVRMHRCRSKEELLERCNDGGADWYVDPTVRADVLEVLDRDGRTEDYEAEMYRVGTGERFWASENAHAIRNADGELLYYQGTLRDVTNQRRAHRLATSRGEILEMIARGRDLTAILYEVVGTIEQYRNRLTAAVCRLDEGCMHVEAAPGLGNPCIEAIDGVAPSGIGGAIASAMAGECSAASTQSETDDARTGALAEAMRACSYEDIVACPVHDQNDVVLGLLIVFVAHSAEIDDEVHSLLREMGQMTSIAFEQHRLAQRLVEQAQYDPLTRLPNRILLADRLQQVMLDAGRNDYPVGVLLLDLDEFKLVNDTLGHSAGDTLLTEVAARLQDCMRSSDTVARFGGDEFVVVVPLREVTEATEIAERILRALQPRVRVKNRELVAHPSIGISLFPQDGLTADNLLQAADTAMYAAKQSGKNQYSYFAESMNQQVSERLRIEAQLRDAIERDQLELHYQPRVGLTDGAIRGAEALLRWQHPDRGLLAPGAFLPVAEQTSLIGEIDQYVLRTVAAQIAAWRGGGRRILVSANLSARDLHRDGFGADVAGIIEDSGAQPTDIELEITESVVMQDVERATRQLRDLKERAPGLRVAIDDFGSGYSSLQYLRQLPIDTLKIDRAFIADLNAPGAERTARAITKTVVDLGHNLDLHVIAEGVETREQADTLLELGCHEAQGYWFAHPLPREDFEQRMARPARPGS